MVGILVTGGRPAYESPTDVVWCVCFIPDVLAPETLNPNLALSFPSLEPESLTDRECV